MLSTFDCKRSRVLRQTHHLVSFACEFLFFLASSRPGLLQRGEPDFSLAKFGLRISESASAACNLHRSTGAKHRKRRAVIDASRRRSLTRLQDVKRPWIASIFDLARGYSAFRVLAQDVLSNNRRSRQFHQSVRFRGNDQTESLIWSCEFGLAFVADGYRQLAQVVSLAFRSDGPKDISRVVAAEAKRGIKTGDFQLDACSARRTFYVGFACYSRTHRGSDHVD